VNVEALNGFAEGTRVTPEELRARGLVRRRGPVKVLGDGSLKVKLTVAAQAFSAQARQKIEQAGGSVELVPAAPRQEAPGASASV